MMTHDMPPAPPRPAHPWIDRYLEHLIVAKGLSEHSIAAYSTDITDFLTFLNEHAGTLEAVSDETVREILEVARWAPSGTNMQPWRAHVRMRVRTA